MVVPGLPSGSHPASSLVFDVAPCCREAARQDPGYRICPMCTLALLRCPACAAALTPMGRCDECVELHAEAPARVTLLAGARAEVAISIHNRGRASIQLHALVARTGDEERQVPLHGRALAPGQQSTVQVPFAFAEHGSYGLTVQVECAWLPTAERLVFAAPFPLLFRIRARHDGPLVAISGTGAMLYAGGGADPLREPLGLNDGVEGRQEVRMEPLPGLLTAAAAEAPRHVTWRSRLIVPDLLAGGAPVELVQSIGHGLVLGRNRPAESAPGAWPSYGVLRYPMHRAGAQAASQALSREHWRWFGSGGSWWIEQLGRSPTRLLLPRPTRVVELAQGQRHAVPDGTQIIANAAQPDRLLFTLRHVELRDSHVLRSHLILHEGPP